MGLYVRIAPVDIQRSNNTDQGNVDTHLRDCFLSKKRHTCWYNYYISNLCALSCSISALMYCICICKMWISTINETWEKHQPNILKCEVVGTQYFINVVAFSFFCLFCFVLDFGLCTVCELYAYIYEWVLRDSIIKLSSTANRQEWGLKPLCICLFCME